MAALACTYVYSSALDLVSAEVFMAKMQLTLKHPAIYLDGGWQALRRLHWHNGATDRAICHSGRLKS